MYTLYNQHLVDPSLQLLFEVYISQSALQPSCTDTTPTGRVLHMLGMVGMENHLPTSEIFWEYGVPENGWGITFMYFYFKAYYLFGLCIYYF